MNSISTERNSLSTDNRVQLTAGRLLARNTLWNLTGQLLPICAGLISIPILVRGLGVDRFGLLSLVWVVIGYFSLFDLGLGRALTKLISDKLGEGDEESIAPLAWTGLLLMFLLGIAGGMIVLFTSGWLVYYILKVPPALRTEAVTALWLVALSIPIVTVTSGLRGMLEARQLFRAANLIKIPASTFNFIAPLFALPFSHSLVPVIVVMIVGRTAAAAAYWFACFQSFPSFRRHIALNPGMVAPVLRFGLWMTVTNIISPIMAYVDRFWIGALLALDAVAYYAASFDMVSRLLMIPSAVAGVLFPAFAITSVQLDDRTLLLLGRAMKYLFLVMFPCILIFDVFAPEILRIWLGAGFAVHGSNVLRLLSTAMFLNALAHIPFAVIQGRGRPDLTAKLHLLEIPVYLTALWLLTKQMGIEGTALAWTARVCLDLIALCFLMQRVVPKSLRLLIKLAGPVIAALAVFFLSNWLSSTTVKFFYVLAILSIFGFSAWRFALGPDERNLLQQTAFSWFRSRPGVNVVP